MSINENIKDKQRKNIYYSTNKHWYVSVLTNTFHPINTRLSEPAVNENGTRGRKVIYGQKVTLYP